MILKSLIVDRCKNEIDDDFDGEDNGGGTDGDAGDDGGNGVQMQ